MRNRYLILLTVLCGIMVVWGCGCDEASKPDSESEDAKTPAESGPEKADKTPPSETADSDDGYLVSTNPDGLELKVRCEKLTSDTFRIHYILENTGTELLYRVVSRRSPYFILIRPIDVARGEKIDGKQAMYETPRSPDMKAEELVILFGINLLPYNVAFEYMEQPIHVRMKAGELRSGSVDIRFPVKRTGYMGVFEKGRGEDEVYEMAKSESGVPCVVAFNYMTLDVYNYMYRDGTANLKENEDIYRLIESKRMILKIK